MTHCLHITRADRCSLDNKHYIEIELTNGSAATVGPGGLCVRVGCTYGPPAHLSVSNHWSIAPGGGVYLTAILPNESLKHVDFVNYIEANGTVHGLGDRLSIGWFVCELKRGAAGADV